MHRSLKSGNSLVGFGNNPKKNILFFKSKQSLFYIL